MSETPRICDRGGCTGKHVARGLCMNHYYQWWSGANPGKRSAANKKWRAKNPEAASASSKRFYLANRDQINARKREIYRLGKEALKRQNTVIYGDLESYMHVDSRYRNLFKAAQS